LSDLPRLLLCSFDVIPGPSGSSRRVTEYLKALPDRFSVVVLSAKTPDHSHIEKYQGARLLRVPVGSGDLASRIQAFERAVRRQLESEEYALAHFTDPFGGYALCELKADYGHRIIYEAQTFPSQELRYTHPQTEGDRRFLSKIRRQELFCLMNADLIITGSQTTRSYIQSLGASEERIHVVRAPVDLKPYAPDALGAPDGQPLRLMYLGSQVGWQGLSTLLRAVAVASKQVDVRLTLVGARHADWQSHLDDLVKELGLKDRVEFQAPVHHDDVAKVLALADVGVLPLDDVERNRMQGGPLAKVSEYFAAGRPVIAADLPITRELIPQGAAVFFPPGDLQALANQVIDLARDIPRRVALGQRARAYAEEVLDAGVIRGRLLDLYDSLLEKRSSVVLRSEDDLPSHTMVTGTPTNRLVPLLPPEEPPPSRKTGPDKDGARAQGSEPPREELPLVMGQVLDEGLDTRLIKTELEVHPSEPPVVMGLPLRERATPSPAGATEHPASVIVDTGIPVSSRSESAEPVVAKSSTPGKAVVPSFVEEPPAPTPIIRVPGTPEADEPPAPTPIVRAPLMRDLEEPPAPTPIVRAPLMRDLEEPPDPTPIVRAPVAAERKEPPAPTPVARSPGPGHREESPSFSPVVRVPAPPKRDEPSAPTPIIRVPAALLMREEAFSKAASSRASLPLPQEDEPPAPTPIVPSHTVLGGRSTSARVETPSEHGPSRQMPPWVSSSVDADRAPSPSRQGATSSDEALPPVGRDGTASTDSGLSPMIRDGTTSADSGPPPMIRDGTTSADSGPPPMIRDGTASADSGPPPMIRDGTASAGSGPPPMIRDSTASADSGPPPLSRGGPGSSDSGQPPLSQSASPAADAGLSPMIRGGIASADTGQPPPSRVGTASSDSGPPPLLRSGTATSGTERPPTVLRYGSTPPAAGPPPLIRGGTATSETERPPSVLRPGAAASEQDRPPPIRGSTVPSEPERPPTLPARAPSPPPVPRQRPPQPRPVDAPRLAPTDSQGTRSVPASSSSEDEPEEISEDEAQPIDDGAHTSATPTHPSPRLDEPDEISSDEVEEAEVSVSNAARLLEDEAELPELEPEPEVEPEVVDEGPAPEPVPSALNPWFAQLAHGYCPPDGIRFDRHPPPTTFPGRDEETHPSRHQPLAQGVVRGKSS